MVKRVGSLSRELIELFGLDYEPGKPITLSDKRKNHMEKHRGEFEDFDKAYECIEEIISSPDFVGRHPNGRSLEYIKKIDGNVLVAVRLSENLTVRTMYVIKDSKLANYLRAGRTKKM